MTITRSALLLLLSMLLVTKAQACTVCDSAAGQQVRHGIFDAHFGQTMGFVLLPGAVLGALMVALHLAWPFLLKEQA